MIKKIVKQLSLIVFVGKCSKKQEVQFNDEEEEGNGPIDVKSNIFLNGNFASAKSESSSSSSSSGAPQGFHSGAKIDLSNNPFLQGSFAHAGTLNYFIIFSFKVLKMCSTKHID